MNIMITGGSKGIGLAIAKTIALQKDQKHAMGICGRNEAELQKADLELRSITPLHEFLVM